MMNKILKREIKRLKAKLRRYKNQPSLNMVILVDGNPIAEGSVKSFMDMQALHQDSCSFELVKESKVKFVFYEGKT